jgi:hypothetical protein
MPVVQGTGRAEPLLAGAGLVGGFLAGGFVAGVGRVLLFQDPTSQVGFVAVTLATVGLAVALITPLARWGWAVAAVGAVGTLGVVPSISGGLPTDNPDEVAALAVAASTGLILGGALLSLRSAGPSGRSWLAGGIAIGLVVGDKATYEPVHHFGLPSYAEAAIYVVMFAVAAALFVLGTPKLSTVESAAGVQDTLIVLTLGGVATAAAVLLDGSPPTQQSFDPGAAGPGTAPSWAVQTSWAISIAVVLVLLVLGVTRAGPTGGRAVIVLSVSALPLVTLSSTDGGLVEGSAVIVVGAAVALGGLAVARADALAPWDAIGLLVALLAVSAPSLEGERTIEPAAAAGVLATSALIAGLGFAFGAALTRLAMAPPRLGQAYGGWRVVGIGVAAALLAREILLPPDLLAAYGSGSQFPDARIWLGATIVLTVALFVAGRWIRLVKPVVDPVSDESDEDVELAEAG